MSKTLNTTQKPSATAEKTRRFKILRPAILSQDEWEITAAIGGQLTLRQTREVLLSVKLQRDELRKQKEHWLEKRTV
jgi:hypothetical protein